MRRCAVHVGGLRGSYSYGLNRYVRQVVQRIRSLGCFPIYLFRLRRLM